MMYYILLLSFLFLLVFLLSREIKLILQLSRFEQQQLSVIGSYNDSLVGNPRLAQIILGFHLLKSELLEVSFAVSKQLEDTVTNHTQLCIILWVERDL